MKIVMSNPDDLSDSDIIQTSIKVKAIIKTDNKILFVKCNDIYQLPGGRIKTNETLPDGLKREVQEETGIVLKNEYDAFFLRKYYSKKYPDAGINQLTFIYYYFIETDDKINESNMNLDLWEKEHNFNLQYISYEDINDILTVNKNKGGKAEVIAKEMEEVFMEVGVLNV